MNWDDIGGGGLVSTVVGGIMGAEGGRRADSRSADLADVNRDWQQRMIIQGQGFQSAEAQYNRDFQERMSGSEWQRGMADMAAAGVNPMLAVMKGGASSPSGSMAGSASAPTGAVGSSTNRGAAAMLGAAQAAQIGVSSAEAGRVNAEKDLIRAQIPGAAARARVDTSTADVIDYELAHRYPQLKDVWDTEGKEARYKLNAMGDPSPGGGSLGSVAERAKLQMHPVELRRAVAEARLAELEMPGARNRAESEDTFWGRNVRPYLGDIGKVVSGTAGAIGAASGLKYLSGGSTGVKVKGYRDDRDGIDSGRRPLRGRSSRGY